MSSIDRSDNVSLARTYQKWNFTLLIHGRWLIERNDTSNFEYHIALHFSQRPMNFLTLSPTIVLLSLWADLNHAPDPFTAVHPWDGLR
jgi:hypothetical protein